MKQKSTQKENNVSQFHAIYKISKFAKFHTIFKYVITRLKC